MRDIVTGVFPADSRRLSIFRIAALLLLACSAHALKLNSVFWELGRIDLTRKHTKTVQVTNDGHSVLEITARATCECIKVTPDDFTLAVGSSENIEIIFDPTGLLEKVQFSVYIESSDEEVPFINYILTADIADSVDVYFFYDENCHECEDILKKLEKLKGKYNFKILKYPLEDSANFEKFKTLEGLYGLKGKKFPALVAGSRFIYGAEDIFSGAENAVSNYMPHKSGIFPDADAAVKDRIINDFKSFKILPVAVAALADGINPCAFAGIIFLVSYLSMVLKKTKRAVFNFGVGYSAGVCIFYFIFGLGIFEFLKALLVVRVMGKAFFLLMGALTAFLSVYSFIDAVRVVSGKGIFLKVPDKMRMSMHKTAERFMGKKSLFLYSFLIGGIVSSFELICTGQIYIPTISYIIAETQYRWAAVFALFLYSVIFTLPLLTVFFVVFFGGNSEKIKVFMMRKNVFKVKILNGIIFAAFAVYLFVNVFK